MANNRMWIECVCGERKLLAKHFGAEWGVRTYGEGSLDEQLDAWFTEHAWCASQDGTHFRLVYEHEAPSGER